MHAYRLKLKQLRYVLELAPDRSPFVADLGEAKNAIGEWHDWEELAAMANELLDHDNCKLMRKLKETADSKFAHAYRVVENLRRNYLHSTSPNRKKKPHSIGLSRAAIAASAALSEGIRRAA